MKGEEGRGNDGSSRAGLDVDGSCHDADGAGKVQCSDLSIQNVPMCFIVTTSATFGWNVQSYALSVRNFARNVPLRVMILRYVALTEWTTCRVVLVCM